MTAPVTTWIARRQHHLKPGSNRRSLCGALVESTCIEPQRIPTLPMCKRCERASGR